MQQLKDRGDSEIRILVPGEQPLQNLGLAFVDETLERLERAHQLQTVDELMRKGATGLASLVRTSPKNHVVLVVDQFEEAFTLCQDPAERQAFFATLLGALADTDRLQLILAMRSDFVGKCFEADYSGLATQVKTHLEPVLPMSPAELTQAITAPARQVGLSLEPGLVEALLKDVDPTSGSLPLLQYTLTELWQRQQDHQLKLSTYMQFGGVTGTLQQRADTVYAALTPGQQHTAKHIFLSLTQLGEGAEDTRRRITQDSLISAQHPEGQVLEGGERKAIVDVAHEALIRNWPKLRQWLDENRDLLRQQRRIEASAVNWREHDYRQGYLLQGRQLGDAKRFWKSYAQHFPFSELTQNFILRSSRWQQLNRYKWITLLAIPAFVLDYALHTAKVEQYYAKFEENDSSVKRNAVIFLTRHCPRERFMGAYDLKYLSHSNSGYFEERFRGMYCRPLDRRELGSIDLNRINFGAVDFRATNLERSNLSSSNLSGANFSSANLNHADLTNARLTGANLAEANLSHTRLIDAQVTNAFLDDALLTNAELRGTSFRGTDFGEANLSGANLSNADLSNTNLSPGMLRNTNLRGANLSAADIGSVDLGHSDLRDVYLYQTDFGIRDEDRPNFDCNVAHNPYRGLTSLCFVDLRGAVIFSTDLRAVKGLIQQQFVGDQAPLICNSLLPEGIEVDGNRDCDELPSTLVERFSDWLPSEIDSIEKAEIFISEQVQNGGE